MRGAITLVETAMNDCVNVRGFLNGTVNVLGLDPNFLILVPGGWVANKFDSYDQLAFKALEVASNGTGIGPLSIALDILGDPNNQSSGGGAVQAYYTFRESVDKVGEQLNGLEDDYALRFEQITGFTVGNAGWVRFGNRQLPTYLGIAIQLNNLEALQASHAETEARLDALAPGARKEIRSANIAALPKREKDVWDKPIEKRTTEEQYIVVMLIGPKIKATNDDVAARVPREKLAQAREIADQLQNLTREMEMTARYRGTVNFDYWRARCSAEQTPEALDAREQVHKAEELREANRSLNDSRENYEKAWENWAIVFKKHPQLFDSIEAQELVDAVDHYADVLGRIEVKFPADFKLKELLEMTEKGQRLKKRLDTLQGIAPAVTPSQPGEKKPEATENPAEKTKVDEKPAAGAKEAAPTKVEK